MPALRLYIQLSYQILQIECDYSVSCPSRFTLKIAAHIARQDNLVMNDSVKYKSTMIH